MSELDLERRNAALARQLDESQQMVRALLAGEIDALVHASGATPVLLHAAQAKLLANEQLLRSVFDGATDAMLISDDDGRTVDANSAACVLFGLSRERLLGCRLADFEHPELAPLSAQLGPNRAGPSESPFRLLRPDGAQRDTEHRATPGILPGLNLSVLRDMTERRRTESRFRTMIEKSHDGIALSDASGTSIYASPAIERILDRTASALQGARVAHFAHPEDRAQLGEVLEGLNANPHCPVIHEFRALHRDGSLRWVEVTARNLLDEPVIGAIVSNFRDITEQKAVRAALLESQRILEEAQSIAHLGSWTSALGPDEAVSWSAECARIFGREPSAAPNARGFLQWVHQDDRARVQRGSERAFEEGGFYETEHRIVRPNGEVRWVYTKTTVEGSPKSGSGSAVSTREGQATPFRAVGVVQDVTERRRVEDELRESEVRYRRIVDNTSEGVWMYDASSITTFMNPRMAEMLGCTVAEALGQPIFTFMDEAAREEARARVARRKRGVADRGDFRLTRRDGSDLWVSLHADPLFDPAGNFESSLALVTDITERRLADETRNRLASIVESSDDAIISRSVDGTIRTWNRGAERLTQYSATEALGKPLAILYPPEDAARLNAKRGEVDQEQVLEQFEMVARRKDGSLVDISITSSVLRDDLGTTIGASVIARDITERKRSEAALRRSEEQFRQAQKMEAVGSLAGGIAHDFNNLLSVILSYTSLLVEGLKESDPLLTDLTEVHKAGLRASGLVRQLLAFSRQQVLQPVVLDLNQVVTGIKGMLTRLLREDIQLSLLISPLAGKIHADPGQVEQVIMNLVVNARDAMPNGGNLSIETANILIDESYTVEHPSVTPGPYVMLAVTDTGIGMDAATKDRIFEPFFTTKELGKGTGLGLSTVYGIVQQSGGHVWVYSELGKGTTFKVYLPRTDRTEEASLGTLGVTASSGGTETILLVEDEDQVRSIMRQVLRKQGYNVLEAQNAGEAFLLCEQFTANIDLLLTDVVMPRMSGRQLAERLALVRPAMRVMYVSGYTDDTIVHHGVLAAGIHFLQKPIMPAALTKKVRQVLDAPLRRTQPPSTH